MLVRLSREAETPSDARRLASTEGVIADLRDDGGLTLDIALLAPSHAEARWELWRLLRQAGSLYRVTDWTIEANDQISNSLLTTVALDLHNAASGRVNIVGRPQVAKEVTRIGKAEDRYRDWVNEDPTTRTSLQIAKDVVAFGEQNDDVTVEVLKYQ